MKKLTYVLMISKTFPSYHPRKGEPTNFKQQILDGIKIHTIRQNYALWEKRAKKINDGLAVLSLREWTGLPRKSPQVEIMQLTKIGLQAIKWDNTGLSIDGTIQFTDVYSLLADNDGLVYEDFTKWFQDCPEDLMAIIHFTDFKY